MTQVPGSSAVEKNNVSMRYPLMRKDCDKNNTRFLQRSALLTFPLASALVRLCRHPAPFMAKLPSTSQGEASIHHTAGGTAGRPRPQRKARAGGQLGSMNDKDILQCVDLGLRSLEGCLGAGQLSARELLQSQAGPGGVMPDRGWVSGGSLQPPGPPEGTEAGAHLVGALCSISYQAVGPQPG